MTNTWPMLILTVMDFELQETMKEFLKYTEDNYPDIQAIEILERAVKWVDLV